MLLGVGAVQLANPLVKSLDIVARVLYFQCASVVVPTGGETWPGVGVGSRELVFGTD
jgi:predicted flavoprotein YhiN